MELIVASIIMGCFYAFVRACCSGRKYRADNHASKPALDCEETRSVESAGTRQAGTLAVGAALMHNDEFIFLRDGESGLDDDDFLDSMHVHRSTHVPFSDDEFLAPVYAHLPGNIHTSSFGTDDHDMRSSSLTDGLTHGSTYDSLGIGMDHSKCLFTDMENYWYEGNIHHFDTISSFSSSGDSFDSGFGSGVDDNFDSGFSSDFSSDSGFDDW